MELLNPALTPPAPDRGSADSGGPWSCLENLDDYKTWASFVEQVSISFARRHRMVGVLDDTGQPLVVMADPQKVWDSFDALRRWLDVAVMPARAEAEDIAACISRLYEAQGGHAASAIESIENTDNVSSILGSASGDGAKTLGGGGDLLDREGRAPVVKLANALLFEAVKLRASDVHLQPTEDRVAVRMRIDGVLSEAFELPRSTHEELVSRVKVMGQMDIAEKRLPQDGRATVQVGPRKIDLRLSTVPTSHGERVVFRLLDKSARLYALDELGMPRDVLKQYSKGIQAEHGLVLVTGPTGSGKSTTLYGSLQQINCAELNVLTLEDPIEYQLPGVSQMQVSEKKGMSFAKGLRSVLRQDPDIIMVGEIRDRETAELAIQAALTGHLVFSTLHTNDAPSAVTRLLDLGIEPYLVSSSLLAVMAQRLVRRVCGECAEALTAGDAEAELGRLRFDLADERTHPAHRDVPRSQSGSERHPDDLRGRGLFRGQGCPACRDTGYRGRVGLYEYLSIDEQLRDAIQERAPASRLKRIARRHGMRSLRDDGVQKVLRGMTTADEVLRVTARTATDEWDVVGPTGQEAVRGEA
ncbi:MAG: ATPase, T2SS/T4P/T4SS family [Planctomycetota bacterium]